MDGVTTGAGLGALGFWIFVATIIATGIWDSIRKRDAQHETLRRVIESGQPIDDELTDKLLSITGGSKNLERDLVVSGLSTLAVAPGILIFGWILGTFLKPVILPVMGAIAALLACIGLGLLGTARVVRVREERENLSGLE